MYSLTRSPGFTITGRSSLVVHRDTAGTASFPRSRGNFHPPTRADPNETKIARALFSRSTFVKRSTCWDTWLPSWHRGSLSHTDEQARRARCESWCHVRFRQAEIRKQLQRGAPPHWLFERGRNRCSRFNGSQSRNNDIGFPFTPQYIVCVN